MAVVQFPEGTRAHEPPGDNSQIHNFSDHCGPLWSEPKLSVGEATTKSNHDPVTELAEAGHISAQAGHISAQAADPIFDVGVLGVVAGDS